MLTVDGVISGFDTTGLIDGILSVQGANLISMEDELQAAEATLEAITELSSLLDNLSGAITDFQDGGIVGYGAVVAEDAGFTITTSAEINPGSYDIAVNNLATSQMDSTEGFASEVAAGTIAQGTLQVTVDGEVHDVVIDSSNDSLRGLAEAINGVDGVSAYVLDTGDPVAPFQLIVQGEQTGTDNAFTIDTSGLGGSGTVPTFSNIRAAENAEIEFNGITVTSQTSTFEVIPGLTIDANEAQGVTHAVDVSADETLTEENIQAFIDAYNEVITHYNTQTVFNEEVGIEGALFGEASARRVIEDLGTHISAQFVDLPESNLSGLALIGIETGQDGKLSLDTDTLHNAINDNAADVVGLIRSATGPLSAMKEDIENIYIADDSTGTYTDINGMEVTYTTSGLLESRKDSLESTIGSLEDSIEREESFLESYGETLRAKFTAMEQALASLNSTSSFLSAFFAPADNG